MILNITYCVGFALLPYLDFSKATKQLNADRGWQEEHRTVDHVTRFLHQEPAQI